MSDDEFALFARLRELRKKIAEEEAIPPYAIFTNEQLADMVRKKVTTLQAMKEINGIGDAKISKYGQVFLGSMIAGPLS